MKQKKLILIMKLVITGIFLFSQIDFSLAYDWDQQPKLKGSRIINPYSFYPKGEYIPPSRAERRPLVSVAPGPLIITDGDGNKILYRRDRTKGDGARSVAVKIDSQGNAAYYSKNQRRFEKDYEGELTRRYEPSSPIFSVRNERGEIIGYEEYGRGGLLLREYDENGYLLRSYEYDGRKLNWVIDELTGVRTKYGLYGPDYELSPEGSRIAYYVRDGSGRLLWRIDNTVDENGDIIDGNKTVYDEKGRSALYVLDYQGNLILTYKSDARGLRSITDQYGNVKIYGKYGIIEERDSDGNLLVSHQWQGTRHVSSYDYSTRQTTYYKIGNSTLSDPYKPDYVLDEEGIKSEDYIDFSEVKDMSVEEIQALLSITGEDATKVYEVIQALTAEGKSPAGTSFVAYFSATGAEDDGDAIYTYNLDIFDQYNKLIARVLLEDPNPY